MRVLLRAYTCSHRHSCIETYSAARLPVDVGHHSNGLSADRRARVMPCRLSPPGLLLQPVWLFVSTSPNERFTRVVGLETYVPWTRLGRNSAFDRPAIPSRIPGIHDARSWTRDLFPAPLCNGRQPPRLSTDLRRTFFHCGRLDNGQTPNSAYLRCTIVRKVSALQILIWAAQLDNLGEYFTQCIVAKIRRAGSMDRSQSKIPKVRPADDTVTCACLRGGGQRPSTSRLSLACSAVTLSHCNVSTVDFNHSRGRLLAGVRRHDDAAGDKCMTGRLLRGRPYMLRAR